jgi:hypothetical protein
MKNRNHKKNKSLSDHKMGDLDFLLKRISVLRLFLKDNKIIESLTHTLKRMFKTANC